MERPLYDEEAIDILVALILAGRMITIVPQLPTVDDQAAVMVSVPGSLLVYAHDDLAGRSFDLDTGSVVIVNFASHSEIFKVVSNNVHIARSTKDAATGDDFMFDHGQSVSDVIVMLSRPDTILLVTCWRGQGNIITGRRFVVLSLVHNKIAVV